MDTDGLRFEVVDYEPVWYYFSKSSSNLYSSSISYGTGDNVCKSQFGSNYFWSRLWDDSNNHATAYDAAKFRWTTGHHAKLLLAKNTTGAGYPEGPGYFFGNMTGEKNSLTRGSTAGSGSYTLMCSKKIYPPTKITTGNALFARAVYNSKTGEYAIF